MSDSGDGASTSDDSECTGPSQRALRFSLGLALGGAIDDAFVVTEAASGRLDRLAVGAGV